MYARSLRQREQIHGRVCHTCTWPAQPRRARTVLHTQRCSMIVPQSHHAAIKLHANAHLQPTACPLDNARAAGSVHRLGRDKHGNEAATIGNELYPLVALDLCHKYIFRICICIPHGARAQQGSDTPTSAHGTSQSSLSPSRVKMRSGSSMRAWIIQIQIQKTCDPGKGLRTRAKRSTVK